MDYFFGPLPQYYCLYFYIISIFGGIFTLLALIGIVTIALSSEKNKMQMLGVYVMLFFFYLIIYFKARLLNTMCVKSI